MSVTDLATDRIINGLLKGHEGSRSPHEIAAHLAKNVVIRCAPGRCTVDDLWPAVWALASVLERQLTGTIYIDAGGAAPLPGPVSLGPRCVFGPCKDSATLPIELGLRQDAATIAGDAKRSTVSLDPLKVGDKPTAIECFILAGYLGFQVLATLAEVPADRADFAQRALSVVYDIPALEKKLRQPDGFTFIGMGQVGQAFLALLWFWLKGDFGGRRIAVIDDDRFIDKNGRTQVLLAHGVTGSTNRRRNMFAALRTNGTPARSHFLARSTSLGSVELTLRSHFLGRMTLKAAGWPALLASIRSLNAGWERTSWRLASRGYPRAAVRE